MPSHQYPDIQDQDRRIEDLTDRLELATSALSKVSRDLNSQSINASIRTAFDKAAKAQQRQLEKQIDQLVKNAFTSALGGLNGQKNSILSSITSLIPGFARGGILSRRHVLAHASEAGPEVVLPLKKTADGRLGIVAQTATSKAKTDKTAPVEVTLVSAQAAQLNLDDQEDIAHALLQAMDHAIDEKITLHLNDGNLFRAHRGLF